MTPFPSVHERRGIRGQVQWACWHERSGRNAQKEARRDARQDSASKRAGLAYEARIVAALEPLAERHGAVAVAAGPWLLFSEDGEQRLMQPDAVVLWPSWTLIVECKRTAQEAHWGQVGDYERLVMLARPEVPVRSLLIGCAVVRGMKGSGGAAVLLGAAGLAGFIAAGAAGPPRAVCHWTL